jgi:hypothetical protein
MVDGNQYLLLLLAGVSARSVNLFYQEDPSAPLRVVNDTARHSANWVGVYLPDKKNPQNQLRFAMKITSYFSCQFVQSLRGRQSCRAPWCSVAWECGCGP